MGEGENILKLAVVMVAGLNEYTKPRELCTPPHVSCMVRERYLN